LRWGINGEKGLSKQGKKGSTNDLLQDLLCAIPMRYGGEDRKEEGERAGLPRQVLQTFGQGGVLSGKSGIRRRTGELKKDVKKVRVADLAGRL